MDNSIQEIQKLGQSVWYDNVRRGMIKSGEIGRLIEIGVTGLTSNPTIFEKAISGTSDYDGALSEFSSTGKSVTEVYEALAMEDIRVVADLLRPVYDATEGFDGYASFEVNPHLAYQVESTVVEATRLFKALGRPNIMVKVPATTEGISAVRDLIGKGINVNVTLTFSLSTYCDVRQAYISGLEDFDRSGGDVSRVASVASFFISRIDTVVDAFLQERFVMGDEGVKDLFGKAAIANAKLAYRDFRSDFGGDRFLSLRGKGARVQRPLWASTSTKNASYSDVLYAESLIGPDTVDTMTDATISAFLEHGEAAVTVDQGVSESEDVICALEEAGINMGEVTDKLLSDGLKLFSDHFDKLMTDISHKMTAISSV